MSVGTANKKAGGGQALRRLATPYYWRSSGYKAVRFILLCGLSFIIIYPLLVKVSSSFMSYSDVLDRTVVSIPRNPTLGNYRQVISDTSYFTALFNTTLISLMCAVLQTFVTAFIGYGLAKFRFKGRGVLSFIVILLMVVPPETVILPMYMQFRFFDIYGLIQLVTGRTLNFIDTLWAPAILSITGLGLKNGLYVFVTRQFFAGTPNELLEAAEIDGAGVFKSYFRIMMPLGSSILLTIFLLSFAWQWTDTFYSLMFFKSYNVLPNILNQLTESVGLVIARQHMLSIMLNTGALLILLPLLILFLFTQRYFVEGIERSGITG